MRPTVGNLPAFSTDLARRSWSVTLLPPDAQFTQEIGLGGLNRMAI